MHLRDALVRLSVSAGSPESSLWDPRVVLEALWMVWGLSLSYIKTSFDALGACLELSENLFESSWNLFESSWSLSEGSRKPPRLTRTFIFKNERFASTGARFLKPVRARTGSELLRERMLSRGLKRELQRTQSR